MATAYENANGVLIRVHQFVTHHTWTGSSACYLPECFNRHKDFNELLAFI